MVHKKGENIFAGILIVIMLIFLYLSLNFGFKASLFPLLFGSLVLIMLCLQVIVMNMKNPPKFLNFITKGGAFESLANRKKEETSSDGELNKDKEENEEKFVGDQDPKWKEVFIIFASLGVYISSFYFIHYLVATLIFLIFFLKFLGKVKWKTIMIFSFSLTGSLFILFEVILGSSH